MSKCFINDHEFNIVLAVTEQEQAKGLMYEKNPYPMLFIFSEPSYKSFWMKNTPSPLDIVFIKECSVVDIFYGEPNSTRMVGPNSLVDMVLELPYGTCDKIKCKKGTKINYKFAQPDRIKCLKYLT